MNWAVAAILNAAIMSGVQIVDSHLLSRRLPSLRAFLVILSPVHLTAAVVLLFIFPLPGEISILPIVAAVGSGMFRGIGLAVMLDRLRHKEVSQVIPIVHAYPVFVAVLAIPVFGETLGALQWLAVMAVVAGAVLVSYQGGAVAQRGFSAKTLLPLLMAGGSMALGDILGKYALNSMSAWNGYSIAVMTMALSFLLFSLRPETLRALAAIEKKRFVFTLLAFSESAAVVGIILFYWALAHGQVSLVSTFAGSRPVFALIYSMILAWIVPGFLVQHSGRKVMLIRLAATLMIFAGIATIYLT